MADLQIVSHSGTVKYRGAGLKNEIFQTWVTPGCQCRQMDPAENDVPAFVSGGRTAWLAYGDAAGFV